MRSHFFFLLLFALVFFLIACDTQPRIEHIEYFSGRHGLTFEFMENSPPPRVYSGQSVPISLVVNNEGAFDVADGLQAQIRLSYDNLYLVGDASQASSWDPESLLFPLRGKSAYWPVGESRFLVAGLLQAQSLGPRTGVDTTISVSLCYPYMTTLAHQVCVDSDPYNLDARSQPCSAEDLTLSNQGAPVAVTMVDFESLPYGTQEIVVSSQRPDTTSEGELIGTSGEEVIERQPLIKPVFTLSIKNVGDGQVVRAREFDSQGSCVASGDGLPSSSVLVRAYLGSRQLFCSPSRDLDSNDPVALAKLISGQTQVVCSLANDDVIASTTNYFDLFRVELAYVYQVRDNVRLEISDTIKQYEPPSLLEVSCSDFHGDYEACKTMSQMGEFVGGVDCYYCEASDSCLTKSGCANNCDGFAHSDAFTRRCVGDCPITNPGISVRLAPGKLSSILTCSEPSGLVNLDLDRCGCNGFSYLFTQDRSSCEDDIVGASGIDGQVVDGRWQATVFTPQEVISGLDSGEDWYLCARSRGANGRWSSVRVIKI